MKRPIREELKDNTLRKNRREFPALSSTVLQDILLDVDLSTKRWRNGTVPTRSRYLRTVEDIGIYLMTWEEYWKFNWTVSGRLDSLRRREVMNRQLILALEYAS
jgi:hypothetical protein